MNRFVVEASGVVVVTLTAAILKWPRLMWNYFERGIRPDHSAMYQGWTLNSSSSGDRRVKVQVVCAPSRSLDSKSINPGASIDFVRIHFADTFDSEPVFSNPSEGLRFESSKKGLQNGYLWVWRSGRVDLIQPVEVKVLPEQGITIDLLSILEPISKLAKAIVSKEYERIFPTKKISFARRFDWFIAVSPTVTTSDGMTLSWSDLEFPDSRPQRASSQQQAFCPVNGFARDELANWKPHGGMESVLHDFLTDFLLQNGYHDCETAINQVLISFGNSN